VPAHGFEGGKHLTRMIEGEAQHAGREELGDDVPAGLVRFCAVIRVVFGDTLAERDLTLAGERDEKKFLLIDTAKARFEEVDEREAEHAKLQSLDAHGPMI
jgi:hypothetical protein